MIEKLTDSEIISGMRRKRAAGRISCNVYTERAVQNY